MFLDMKRIASKDNPHYKAIKKLCQSSRERRKTGLFLLDGIHLIESYTFVHKPVEELLLRASAFENAAFSGFLEEHAANVKVTILEDALFETLALVDTPSGIMAIAAMPEAPGNPKAENDAVLLDGIQDPGNLGSILRTAAAAGFRQILLSPDCAQAWAPKTLRAAMGAHFQLAIHENQSLSGFLGCYRGQAVLTLPDAARPIHALDLTRATAWVFGSEGQGISESVRALVDVHACIPMPGKTESLNVSAAAAICLFETVRQRAGSGNKY